MDTVTHNDMANAIRALAMDAVEAAKSGHPGMPMGCADLATVLVRDILRFDPSDPLWPDRDRLVLSAGHGSMLLYALAYLTGYERMGLENIKNFRQLGHHTPGHPEHDPMIGVETTTGPLGQGLGNAVGMALAERILNARFGDDLVDHHTYVIASDGDLMEGISHEAAGLAGHLKLSRLIVLWDDNRISIDGSIDLSTSEDVGKRFEAYGWDVLRIDGHDESAIAGALLAAKASDRPSLIACRTVIGKGAPTKAGTAGSHGAPLGAEEIAGARAELGWPHAAFDVPTPILDRWRAAGRRGAQVRAAWQDRHAAHPDKDAFDTQIAGDLAPLAAAIDAVKAAAVAEPQAMATRQASGKVLDALLPVLPQLIGGSADLTGSNNTRTKTSQVIAAGAYGGSYIHYGIREHGMAAAMNGMALHGGIIPYGGTFLIFSDYCRPSIRLAALMGQRVIFVLTHDSIGLGEDGPTHQPVEHVAALRAIPNLLVLRPADLVETAECWQIALENTTGPSAMVLTRQGIPPLPRTADTNNACRTGAYVLSDSPDPQVVLLASGSEVHLALAAKDQLAGDGIAARVVSVPCMELFQALPAAEHAAILGDARVNIAVEAAVRQGWDALIGRDGGFVGMTGFGDSAPAKVLFQHFGITSEAVADAARARLSGV